MELNIVSETKEHLLLPTPSLAQPSTTVNNALSQMPRESPKRCSRGNDLGGGDSGTSTQLTHVLSLQNEVSRKHSEVVKEEKQGEILEQMNVEAFSRLCVVRDSVDADARATAKVTTRNKEHGLASRDSRIAEILSDQSGDSPAAGGLIRSSDASKHTDATASEDSEPGNTLSCRRRLQFPKDDSMRANYRKQQELADTVDSESPATSSAIKRNIDGGHCEKDDDVHNLIKKRKLQ